MASWLSKITGAISKESVKVKLNNITNSKVSVKIIKKLVVLSRPKFTVTEKWFDDLLTITYDDEIKSKYVPHLHQSSDFERTELRDVLNFREWLRIFTNQIKVCDDIISRFKKSYSDFYQILEAESINISDKSYPPLEQIDELHSHIGKIESHIKWVNSQFELSGYEVLLTKEQLTEVPHPIYNSVNFYRKDWSKFLDREPDDYHTLRYAFQHHNEVYNNLRELNVLLGGLRTNANHKIIAGNAGTGKTHISAHLIKTIKGNGDYVIFFKPKQFNGDNVELEERLLRLLRIPAGYTLGEIINKLNLFTQAKNKRCFIIIDALNETTKSSIGFSNIWSNHLQSFINQIRLHSHLYLICTLRTSYVENIWPIRPATISEIKGFQRTKDIKEACEKYFSYYKIIPINKGTADLSYFRIPLLLDLFCKLTNESREVVKEIDLNINTYLQIFEDYILCLTSEVKQKLNLQKSKLITSGLTECSEKFLANNEAIISVDDFSDAFDKDDTVTKDNSIARSVLEGYLIFIKDIVGRNSEIVKHTQQEVGGYLLAKNLSAAYHSIKDLINSPEFRDKLVGTDPSKHHQLRLDILKFLIALRPEIIQHLNDSDGLKLSWWYLYNGFDNSQNLSVPENLLFIEDSKEIVEHMLIVSSAHWFNSASRLNFHFVSKVLERLDAWVFDACWTFYIYKEVDFFFELVEDSIRRIKECDGSNQDYCEVVAKFIAFTTATTIRELRDLATIYLIEFGKKHPLSLLKLIDYSSFLSDNYIYERLVTVCYGVALIMQNDDEFVEKHLPEMASRMFDIQFDKSAAKPSYNYIVVDSIKHLLDLAIHKGVLTLSEEAKENLDNYNFPDPYDWIPPSIQQVELINNSSEMSWPEPIGMDFGIYTIPRLIKNDDISRREAIANVYKRIYEIGYKRSESLEFTDERFKGFYYAHRIPGYEGKIDRLGKKYSWKAFFDFAGVLLRQGKLDVYKQNDSGKQYYSRLGDVDIDISMPFLDYKLPIRVYQDNLLANRDTDLRWYQELKIDTLTPLFQRFFEKEHYIMLYGKVDQRVNEDYKIRSFLLAETFFIKKDENFERLQNVLPTPNFDWNLDLHISPDHLSNVYFGELYWADNMPEPSSETGSIPTGCNVKIKFKLDFQDTLNNDNYSYEDIGKEVEETHPERLHFESEPTLVEYLWESDSTILKGFREYYPSIKMGRSLGLRAEPRTGKILDSDLKECFHCIEFQDLYFQNTFNYMRSDLLRKYMSDNNLSLLYQVKQHSYDMNSHHNRSMKFFLVE